MLRAIIGGFFAILCLPAQAEVYRCDAVESLAQLAAPSGIPVGVSQDSNGQACVFSLAGASSDTGYTYQCNKVRRLAVAYAPKDVAVTVYGDGGRRECTFSVAGETAQALTARGLLIELAYVGGSRTGGIAAAAPTLSSADTGNELAAAPYAAGATVGAAPAANAGQFAAAVAAQAAASAGQAALEVERTAAAPAGTTLGSADPARQDLASTLGSAMPGEPGVFAGAPAALPGAAALGGSAPFDAAGSAFADLIPQLAAANVPVGSFDVQGSMLMKCLRDFAATGMADERDAATGFGCRSLDGGARLELSIHSGDRSFQLYLPR